MRSLAPASYLHVNLLLRRMTLLSIKTDVLRSEDPLLFWELEGRCSLCPSTERCSVELASSADGEWRDYCPNQSILATLGKEEPVMLDAIP